ncbi:ABC transporter permease [Vibrio pomeroyi]|uniref:Transport permease protein n=1 Tax=Vibrio pomeroyi TaxID=198832 RepID=A0ABV4N4C2_9VIBR|nr:ABC transporter permease [Vibrio kanaloae]MCG9555988.1 ABC transporter permease [Vibrio kanaloae]
MERFNSSPFEMLSSCIRNHSLLKTMTKREVVGRYKGSFFGLMWSFITPLLMLAVYTFVFGEVFNARWHTQSESSGQFALMLFAGLIIFNLFSEVVNRAPSLIIVNVSYVKKVVFPLEILPLTVVYSALFHCLVSIAVWLCAYIALFGTPHITILLLPIILAPLVILTLGLAWLLAGLGVFIRDIGQMVGLLTTAMMFLSPIFFPITSLPEQYRDFVYFNPLTLPIEELRLILFWGEMPNWDRIGGYSAIALLIASTGFYFFQKTRKGFADVL